MDQPQPLGMGVSPAEWRVRAGACLQRDMGPGRCTRINCNFICGLLGARLDLGWIGSCHTASLLREEPWAQLPLGQLCCPHVLLLQYPPATDSKVQLQTGSVVVLRSGLASWGARSFFGVIS